jgi:hypothetical protein
MHLMLWRVPVQRRWANSLFVWQSRKTHHMVDIELFTSTKSLLIKDEDSLYYDNISIQNVKPEIQHVECQWSAHFL